MDLEWELFRARANSLLSAENKAKGALPPPPPPVLPQVVTTSLRVEELEEPKPKRIRTPFLAALKNNRLSRSLDMLPVEDLHATTATTQAKPKPSKQKSITPELGESSSSISPDSPETTRRSGRKGARKDTKSKPSQPVSPRTSYDKFKRFGRKKDKAPDTASSSPPKTLAPPPDRFHNSQFKPGSLDEGEQRNTSSWGRAWGRSAERRKDSSGSEQPTAGNPHHFVIPHDLMRRTLDRLPADVYFKPLDEGEPSGDDTAAPCYMEGPDDSEAEVALPYSAGGCSGSHSRDSDVIGESGEEGELGRNGTVRACGQSVSTYPRVLVMPGTRLGDPVCDCFALRLYRNGAIFCVCDGCGWGRAAVDAARSVRAVFMHSLHQHSLIVKQSSRRELKPTSQASAERSSTGLDVDDPLRGRSRSDASGSAKGKGKVRRGAHRVMEMMGVGANNNGEDSKRSIRQAAECLMQLVAKAHNNIISGKEAWECGTTTVCAGLVVDLDLNAPNSPLTADDPAISKRSALLFTTDKRPGPKHTSPRRNSDADGGPDSRKRRRKGLLVVSIGDCKVYLYSHASGTIKDLTEGNRQNATSVNDCGGRLGPASGMESTEPDLRNLDLYFAECDEGDCVWAVSDGVHDNFDPQMLGLMPHDLDEQRESVTWEDLAPETAARLKNEFAVRALEHELLSPPPPPRQPSPRCETQTQQGDEQLRPSLSTVTQMMQEPSSTQIFYEMMSRGQRNRETAPAVVLSDHGRDSYLAISDVSAPETEREEVVDDASGCPQDPAPPLPELSRLAISGSAKRPATDGACVAGRRPIVLSPMDVTRKLISLCVEQTLHTRNFMEQNPEKRQPCDYRAFPGKLDHTTCLAFHT